MWILAVALAAAWIVSAVLPREPSSEALRLFGPEYLSAATKRATMGYVASGLAGLATFAALRLFSRSRPVSGLFSGAVTTWGAAKMGFLLGAAASVLFSLVSLPFSAYSGYFLERKFGLMRMTFWAWFADYAKASLFDLLAYGIGAAFVAWAVFRLPRGWHVAVAFAFLLAGVVMSAIYPLVIAPAFNKFHPLEDASVLEDVRSLSAVAGMEVDRVLVMEASAKTARVNAYFAGIGRTREVVLYDTLLTGHSPAEVRLVVAHELGHWRYGHVTKGLAASALGAFIALSLFRACFYPTPDSNPLGSYRSLEAVLMALLVFTVLFSYITTPLSNRLSRSFEAQADAFSLAISGDKTSFVSNQVKLARGNLSDVEPPPFIRWFAWTHPTTIERIASAR